MDTPALAQSLSNDATDLLMLVSSSVSNDRQHDGIFENNPCNERKHHRQLLTVTVSLTRHLLHMIVV